MSDPKNLVGLAADPVRNAELVSSFIKACKQQMKYQIFRKYQDSNWIPTNLYSTDLDEIIRKAQECSEDSIAYGMTAVVEASTNHRLHVVEFPGGGGHPRYIAEGYTALVTLALQHKTEISPKSCPDCKDGFYYPLIGPKEPCPTCSSLSNDSKLIMHLHDVRADHPWGLTKISKPKEKPMTDHQIISGKIMKSCIQHFFVGELTTDVDKLCICFVTDLSLDRVDFLLREALEDFDLIKEESYLTPRGDGYSDGTIQYEFNKISKSNLEKINIGKRLDAFIPENWGAACVDIIKEHSILDDIVIDKVTANSCPDCKDGFYYPLIGSPEPCRTCK